MNKKIIKIKFHRIDDFNRAIFKDINKKSYWGNTYILFSHDANEEDVLDKINEEDLSYFGTKFNCEPLGLKISDSYKLQIIKTNKNGK